MSPKRNLSAEARKAFTVETVIELCAEEDPATLTTGEIAKRMQVTQGALFRHFPSKDAIWEAVAEWVAQRVMDELDRAAATATAPLAALEAMFHAHVAFILRHPGVPRVLMGQLQHDRQTPARRVVRSLLARYRERVLARLGEARDAGALRAELDLEAAAVQFIGTVQGLVMQALLLGDMSRMARQAPLALDIYLHGIRACPGARP